MNTYKTKDTREGETLNHDEIKIGISEEFRLNKERKTEL